MWELRSKTYWIYKELASHHLQQSSCWDLVFLPQQWTRYDTMKKDENSTSKLKAASLVIAFILLYKLKLSRSKHGRELLMGKIDTKLMRKLKNRKYIVNMWKTLVEAKRPRSRISWFITKYGDIFPSAPTMMNSS
ncbi:hypothetical protein SELMODRAFT_426258 [Selaginella moellendorffii]|uniref:Uncharacterized protein n=1 Tax=Selaginella moellendorffii TaxID=88036 RepID=D8SVV2_SELML|nr:hypothetical protein SELMODRAFT_426258 [Selaginella moellendorffii]